jgi:hypothetical protein
MMQFDVFPELHWKFSYLVRVACRWWCACMCVARQSAKLTDGLSVGTQFFWIVVLSIAGGTVMLFKRMRLLD